MKVFTAVILILSMLCGCTAKDDAMDRIIHFRKSILEANGCSFHTIITADYGDSIHTFQMDCTADSDGNLNFVVAYPETIAGISGAISAEEASLTFDDKILAFPMLADGQITPVCSPWLFLSAFRGGYISGYSENDSGLCVYIDDSFHDYPLEVEISTDREQVPNHVELIWQGRRILSLEIQNFKLL